MIGQVGEPVTAKGTTSGKPVWNTYAIVNKRGVATFAKKLTVRNEDGANALNVSLDGGATFVTIPHGDVTGRTFKGPATAVYLQAGSGTAGVRASLDLGTVTTDINTVIEADAYGTGGTAITIALTPDGSVGAAGQLVESAYPNLVFKYKDGVTTVAQFEAALASSSYIRVKTPGTAAHVFHDPADTLAATNLAGGVDGATTKWSIVASVA
jgi:hypothetical protein